MKKLSLLPLLLASTMGIGNDLFGLHDHYPYSRSSQKSDPYNPKMKLSSSDEAKLAELHGKAKKAFVKELREKYKN